MNKVHSAVLPLIVILLVVIVYASYHLAVPEAVQTPKNISVIVEDSSSNRWRAFREGLSQGILDEDVVLNVVSTGTFSDENDLIEVIRREQSSGADGLIVCPDVDDSEGTLSTLLASIPTVLVETDFSGEQKLDSVVIDGYVLGQTIAQLIIDDGQLTGETTIGILSGNQKTVTMRNALQGFLDTLGSYADQVSWTLSEQSLTSASLLRLSMEAKPVSILAALDNTAMEAALDYLADNDSRICSLYGAGRSERCIYYLDEGLISALAVPDEFMLGYEAMKLLLEKINTYAPAARSREIQILSVNKANLHDADIASILFPTVS